MGNRHWTRPGGLRHPVLPERKKKPYKLKSDQSASMRCFFLGLYNWSSYIVGLLFIFWSIRDTHIFALCIRDLNNLSKNRSTYNSRYTPRCVSYLFSEIRPRSSLVFRVFAFHNTQTCIAGYFCNKKKGKIDPTSDTSK